MLDSPTSGYYKIPPEVVKFRKKTGEVREEAKQKMIERVSEYKLYEESKFITGIDEFTIHELAEEVAGSKNVAADEDEIDAVKRSLKVLVQFELLEVDEDDVVSQPSADKVESNKESPKDTSDGTDDSARENTGESNEERTDTKIEDENKLQVELEIQMDITDMEPSEIENKLKSIRDSLNDGE